MNHGIPRIALLGVLLGILAAAAVPAPAEAQLGRLRNAPENAPLFIVGHSGFQSAPAPVWILARQGERSNGSHG